MDLPVPLFHFRAQTTSNQLSSVINFYIFNGLVSLEKYTKN